MTEPAPILKHFDRTLADLKAQRLEREPEWQQIADHFDPTKDFSVTAKPNQLVRRRVTSSIPSVARQRCAAIIAGYLVDPTQPFVLPNVEEGLVASGFPGQAVLSAASSDYLSNVAWRVFGKMMRPKSGFLASTALVSSEMVGYGTGIMATLRRRGYGPRYLHRPLRACWIAENEYGEVDTLYYEYCLPLWRVKDRFPAAKRVAGWDTDGKPADQAEAIDRTEVTILHVVEPRSGGRAGAVREAKPFSEHYVSLEKKTVLEEGGYDSFPFSVPRLNRIPGSPYGRGLCWAVLPDAMVLSFLQQMVEQGVGQRVLPTLFTPARMFGKQLDRRLGAVNQYDAAGLGFQDARTAIQKIDVSGDVNVGEAYMRFLTQNIEQGLFTDWMRLRETGQMTAEEVIERRELRLRAMTAFIPGVDRDLMGVAADRTLEIMIAEGQLGDPPDELAGRSVEWDYAGPLARAQQRQQAEATEKLFNLALLAEKLEPGSATVIDFAEQLRGVAEAWGSPTGTMRSREAVAQQRAALAERQDTMEQLQAAQAGATTLRDAGQGVNSLQQAANGGQPAQAA